MKKKSDDIKINNDEIIVEQIEHHRNGISGNGFDVVLFRWLTKDMIAIVFEERGNIAVFERHLLGQGRIGFGENSWRGDLFEDNIRRVIAEVDENFMKKEG